MRPGAHCEHLSLGFFSVKSDLTGPFLEKIDPLESLGYRKFPAVSDFISVDRFFFDSSLSLLNCQ